MQQPGVFRISLSVAKTICDRETDILQTLLLERFQLLIVFFNARLQKCRELTYFFHVCLVLGANPDLGMRGRNVGTKEKWWRIPDLNR